MSKSALELIAAELQKVALSESDAARAAALAGPTNQKVREAADARLRFEDETEEFTLTQKEHEDILRALERRDAAQARAALNWHIQRSKQKMLADLAATVSDAETPAE